MTDLLNIPDHQEYYKRSIPIPGAASRRILSRLTYCIDPNLTEKRTILLTPYEKRFLAPGQSIQWEQLTEETRNQLTGNFYQDKFLVKRIRQDPSQFSHFGIAIHHLGPVPVLMTNHFYKQELHGEEVDAQVVLYYNRPSELAVQLRTMFPNNLVLVQSLTGNYDLIMQRYFEDVAQIFNAIATKSNLSEAFEWSKLAEDFIGQSIQSKLKESMPPVDDWRLFNLDQINRIEEEKIARCNLFSEHHSDIFLAQYFRNTALYFINEFYKHLGLESRSNDYLERTEKSHSEYDELLGAGASSLVVENIVEMAQLSKLRRLYRQHDLAQISRMNSGVIWMQGMINFAKFLLNLNQNYVSPTKGRIFISYNHQVSSSEVLKSQIIDYYQTHNRDDVQVLTVEGLPAGADFIDAIKTRIWQTDRMFIIVPKDTSKSGADDRGSYHWLAKEAEHGFYLDKTVTFLLESQYDRHSLEAALGDENMEFLSPTKNRLRARSQNLLADFKRRHRLNFSISEEKKEASWKELNDEMKETLMHNAEKAIAIRHHNMVKGFLSQFPEDTLITLKCLTRLSPNLERFTKDEAEQILNHTFGTNSSLPFLTMSKTRKTFLNAWNHARSRSFEINKILHQAMSIEREGVKHYYSLSLSRLLKALQPKISEERIQNWIETLFNEVIPEKAKSI